MAKSGVGDDVDFDFFDSPRTTDKNERNHVEESTRSSRDDVSESTVTSAKPPTHPNAAAARKGKNRDDSSDSDGRDSPRSNASASTAQSKRTIEAKIPSVGLHHDSDDDYDDKKDYNSDDERSGERSHDRSSYSLSNDEHSIMRSSTPNGKTRNVKNVKHSREKSNSIDNGSSISSKDVPKPKYKDNEREKAKKKSAYLSDDSDGSDVDITDTDSDVTEVSPLNSPHKPPVLPRQRSAKPRSVRNANSTSERNGSMDINRILSAHKDTMDLKVLLQTVLDMENEGSAARSRRVASRTAQPSGDFCRQRRNYSFTNEQVLKIDRENQRLMENIMRKAREAKKVKQELKMASKRQTFSTPSRPASSAINRFRQQQKIEVENMGILRRLQKTRPTKELQRDVQIDEYKRHLVFAGSASVSSIQPRTRSSFARYADSTMTEPPSGFDEGNTIRKRRPQSAFVTRPQSGKKVFSKPAVNRARSASLKKESAKDLPSYDDAYDNDFEVDELN